MNSESQPGQPRDAARASDRKRVTRWRTRNPELHRLRQRFYGCRYRAKLALARLEARLGE